MFFRAFAFVNNGVYIQYPFSWGFVPWMGAFFLLLGLLSAPSGLLAPLGGWLCSLLGPLCTLRDSALLPGLLLGLLLGLLPGVNVGSTPPESYVPNAGLWRCFSLSQGILL